MLIAIIRCTAKRKTLGIPASHTLIRLIIVVSIPIPAHILSVVSALQVSKSLLLYIMLHMFATTSSTKKREEEPQLAPGRQTYTSVPLRLLSYVAWTVPSSKLLRSLALKGRQHNHLIF